ncbi:MAG: NAD(P)-dependent oxidoreductase [Alphaproteobacteria bacterium]
MDRPLIFMDPWPRTEAMVLTPDTRAALEALGELVVHFGDRAPDALIERHIGRMAILIGQTAMPRERLDRAPHLRAIVNVKGNWEPNVDYAAAQARGIHVLSAAPAMAPAVAEMCVGLAIALGRGIVGADKAFRAGTEAYGIAGNGRALSLYGAPVGLIGYGNLGRALVPLLRPFGPAIRVHDPWLSDGYLAAQGVAPASLDDVLRLSRVLFVLAGVTVDNEGFLDRAKLATIPADTCVVLASRAEVVDFDALVAMAGDGRFRAAIDVFPQEPAPADAPVRAVGGDTILSAHRAGGIADSYARIRAMMVDDVAQILAGHPPQRLQRAEPAQAAAMRSR